VVQERARGRRPHERRHHDDEGEDDGDDDEDDEDGGDDRRDEGIEGQGSERIERSGVHPLGAPDAVPAPSVASAREEAQEHGRQQEREGMRAQEVDGAAQERSGAEVLVGCAHVRGEPPAMRERVGSAQSFVKSSGIASTHSSRQFGQTKTMPTLVASPATEVPHRGQGIRGRWGAGGIAPMPSARLSSA